MRTAGAMRSIFPSKRDLRIGVERDAHRQADADLADVDFVDAGLDDHARGVGDGEQHGAGVERRDAGGDRLADLDVLGEHDAVHRRDDVRAAEVRRPTG